MKRTVLFCTILAIILMCLMPMNAGAAGENSFYTWLSNAQSGQSKEIASATKSATQLLSVRLVKDAIDENQMEIIKNMSQSEVDAVEGMLARVVRGVSFNASDEAVKYFKAASKNAPFVDIGFAEYHELDFNIGFAVGVNDTFITEGKTYYAYRYDSENDKLISLGRATVLFANFKPYIGFETNCVDDFFITDRIVDVNYIQNNAPPEHSSSAKLMDWGNMPGIVRLVIIAVAIAVVFVVLAVIFLKILKRQI